MASLDIQELREAAVFGDVEFLKKCVESNKPIQYYTTFFSWDDDHHHHGNIFHMAARENREEFIREVIGILPVEDTQKLILQPCDNIDDIQRATCNPLHEAARVGNVEIVKMFLNVYKSSSLPSDHSKRPWLQRNDRGHIPCHLVFFGANEECALEIFKMDMELHCNMPTRRGTSLLYEAIIKRFLNLALQIVRSPHSICCTGIEGATPLHFLHFLNCPEEEEICRGLLQRAPEQIKQKTDSGNSIFHRWAKGGKLWPFKCFVESCDIIPDVRRVFVDMVAQTNHDGDNPLHSLLAGLTASEEFTTEIAKFLIDVYKRETSGHESSISPEDQLPWLMENNKGDTPLSLGIARQYENFAMYILSLDENSLLKCQNNVLFLAIEKGCHGVAEKILEIVNNRGWTQILFNDHQNVLHLAPLCTRDFCKQLMEGHPELLNRVDRGGITIIHSWIRNSEVWPFEYLLTSKWRSSFSKLIGATDYKDRDNPFHVAATALHETTDQLVELLVEAFKEEMPNWNVSDVSLMPWFQKNKKNQGPLHLAISNQREKLALYILSLLKADRINTLLDYYEPEHSTLFLAIQNNCSQVSKAILARLDKESWSKYVKDSSSGRNILHLAPSLTDIELGTWLVNVLPEYITEKDNNGQSAWDKAYEVGPTWFIKEVLKKDPTVFSRAPLAWIKACENGHVSALRAFIDHNPGAFRDICIVHKKSPLHHIRLQNVTEYEEFLKIPCMKDLLNVQDSQEETPLHKAIRNEDIYLTEMLLNMDKIIYDINDNQNITAMDLLAHVCKKQEAWRQMCKRNGLDPKIKTAYFQHKTNLLDVRTSLFVVAALLATITFTAGFTLPGGFTQDTGEALLAKRACFQVFMVSDTLALFFSMLVLICLTWSMVFSPSKSLILIDRSMVLLRVALNCTLVAFMTGVYTVIAPKSLWVAILIIVIISSLIVISVNKNFLYEVMDKLFPAANKECRDPMRLLELGYNSREEQDALLSHNGQGSDQST
ncbi:hypothetical protein SOVF_016380 [Spinacia oleracea]|nr:hypothetical protein SOVF_016380 [Spinacia oleracea]